MVALRSGAVKRPVPARFPYRTPSILRFRDAIYFHFGGPDAYPEGSPKEHSPTRIPEAPSKVPSPRIIRSSFRPELLGFGRSPKALREGALSRLERRGVSDLVPGTVAEPEVQTWLGGKRKEAR